MGRPRKSEFPQIKAPHLPCFSCDIKPRMYGSYCDTCSQRIHKDKVLRIKLETFERYGSKCVCCGELEIAFLCIDHIDDNAGDRMGTKGGYAFYLKLRNLGYPEGFQVLCANCNLAKSMGGCPHQTKE